MVTVITVELNKNNKSKQQSLLNTLLNCARDTTNYDLIIWFTKMLNTAIFYYAGYRKLLI
jgi:hypothetical protein